MRKKLADGVPAVRLSARLEIVGGGQVGLPEALPLLPAPLDLHAGWRRALIKHVAVAEILRTPPGNVVRVVLLGVPTERKVAVRCLGVMRTRRGPEKRTNHQEIHHAKAQKRSAPNAKAATSGKTMKTTTQIVTTHQGGSGNMLTTSLPLTFA